MIEHIHVKGYRLFKDFETKLQPGINVLIGANASGKSSLVEFLRIIQSCAEGPIPPGIETKPSAGEVFHPDAGQFMSLGVELAMTSVGGRRTGRYYSYEVALKGSMPPVILSEDLSRPPSQKEVKRIREQAVARKQPGGIVRCVTPIGSIFHAVSGSGRVYVGKEDLEWKLRPNEPLLSKMVDPRLREASDVRNMLLGWRFHTDLHVSRGAPVRSPQPIGSGIELAETGSNLSSVLLSLFTNLDYEEPREALISFLRASVQEFENLRPTPDPSGKYVLLQWRERGVNSTLAAADLSDGILRLLLLGVVCCNPHPPSLICIDEPETGLHPKVLPLVGGLLRHAAERSQVIVLTHSPEMLYGMPLESIAVMRKEEGEAKIVWPKDHKLLYEILTEEIAGERELNYERLSEAFLSGELDTLG